MNSKSHNDESRGVRFRAWYLWLALSVSALFALTHSLLAESGARQLFLPGQTTSGHYQIELSCAACHTENFADGQAIQSACQGCHQAELNSAQDSHPREKFTDPRNSDRVAQLDARVCATCHVEHQAERVTSMGVTVAEDYCYRCHQDVANERPSHQGMAFTSCDDAGCHNFHDNQALYEDFLNKHADEADHLATPSPIVQFPPAPGTNPLKVDEADGDPSKLGTLEIAAWESSAHGKNRVNCSDCHSADTAEKTVGHEVCAECHAGQVKGWSSGRHGMRAEQGLPAFVVAEARSPMKSSAAHLELSCNSCHPAHSYDLRTAAVSACLGCHADSHSQAYQESAHFALLEAELQGVAAPGTGVSCATCHMPRVQGEQDGRVLVDHNQNANLRPNEKMIRPVCMQCHGLGFSLNALADAELVKSNFDRAPAVEVKSIEMSVRRNLVRTK